MVFTARQFVLFPLNVSGYLRHRPRQAGGPPLPPPGVIAASDAWEQKVRGWVNFLTFGAFILFLGQLCVCVCVCVLFVASSVLFCVVWFIVGQSWVYSSDSCKSTAPALYTYSLILIICVYITIAFVRAARRHAPIVSVTDCVTLRMVFVCSRSFCYCVCVCAFRAYWYDPHQNVLYFVMSSTNACDVMFSCSSEYLRSRRGHNRQRSSSYRRACIRRQQPVLVVLHRRIRKTLRHVRSVWNHIITAIDCELFPAGTSVSAYHPSPTPVPALFTSLLTCVDAL